MKYNRSLSHKAFIFFNIRTKTIIKHFCLVIDLVKGKVSLYIKIKQT